MSCCSASAIRSRTARRSNQRSTRSGRSTIFTTHTPVPAGHDAFPFSLVETHLSGAWGTLGAYRDAFLALGHYDNGSGPLFNMTALALRTANFVNGVSQLHGQVTRDMWAPIWPGLANEQRPVRAITNGIHVPTWLSLEMAALLDDYLPADWRDRVDDAVDVGGRRADSRLNGCGRHGRRFGRTCLRSCGNARASGGRKNT